MSYGERVTYRIAIRGNAAGGVIWIESATLGTYVPLYNASSDPSTGYVIGDRWNGSIVEAGGYLYISGLGMKHTKGDQTAGAPLVWDGFCDISQTAEVQSGTTSIIRLSGACAHVRPGDRVTVWNNLDSGLWIETRTIVSISGNNYTVDRAYSIPYSAGSFVAVVRIDYMGIERPVINSYGQQPNGDSVEAWSTSASDSGKEVMISGLLNTGVYKTENLTLGTGITADSAVPTVQTKWVFITYARVLPTCTGDLTIQTTIDHRIVVLIEAGDHDKAYPLVVTAAKASGGNLTTGGVYQYRFVLRNSPRDVSSNPVDIRPTQSTTARDALYAGATEVHLTSGGGYGMALSGWAEIEGDRFTYTSVRDDGAPLYSLIGCVGIDIAHGSGAVVTAAQQVYGSDLSVAFDTFGMPTDSLAGSWGNAQVDYLDIWRTQAGGDVYYLLDTLKIKSNTAFLSLSYTDTKADTDLVGGTVWNERVNGGHDAPPALTRLKLWNSHLMGVDALNAKNLHWSAIVGYEYYPMVSVPTGDVSTLLVNMGGYWEIGTESDPIMPLVPDYGSYGDLGIIGASLLVSTKSRAVRFSGHDISDFRVDDAFNYGCIAPNAALNCGGIIVWPSRAGIMAVQAGYSDPRIISRPIRDSLASYGTSGGEALWANACAVYWNDYYIITAPAVDGTMTPFCCFLGDNGQGGKRFAWTQCETQLNARWYHVSDESNNTGDYGGNNDLLYCDSLTAGTIWRVAPWLRSL